jgi:polyhydroxybutyrate depolymerase
MHLRRAAWFLAGAALVAAALAVRAPSLGVASPAPASRSAGCTNVTTAYGDQTISITVGGIVRNAVVHVPKTLPRRAAPMVLAFHGTGGSGRFMSRYSGLSAVSDRAGFLAVYPSAARSRWTLESDAGPDDIAFVSALLDELGKRYCVAQRQVSAVGVSNGAGFAARLACEMSERIAAVVAVAGGFSHVGECGAERAIAVMEIHGTSDPVVQYAGARAWLSSWVARDGCSAEPEFTALGPMGTRVDWPECRRDSAVSHIKIMGGMHQWPGATPPDRGPVSGISAAEEAWRFLAGRRITAASWLPR